MQRYVSKELTHFVGRKYRSDELEQFKLLVEILKTGRLKRHPKDEDSDEFSMSMSQGGQKFSDGHYYNLQCVCFCDIPANDLAIHMRKYSRFGLSFLKDYLINKGANPVFYVAQDSLVINREATKTKVDHFDEALGRYRPAIRGLELLSYEKNVNEQMMVMIHKLLNFNDFLGWNVFAYVKFFDSTLRDEDSYNYYMEREWRIPHIVAFNLDDVYRIVIPKEYVAELRKEIPDYNGQITFAE